MLDWHAEDIKRLVESVAAARKAAYAAAPRSGGNDHVEASLFIAMFKAFDEWLTDQGAAAEPTASSGEQEPLPPIEPLTEDEPAPEPAPELEPVEPPRSEP